MSFRRARCPYCHRELTVDPVAQGLDRFPRHNAEKGAGAKRCPNAGLPIPRGAYLDDAGPAPDWRAAANEVLRQNGAEEVDR